MKKENSSRKRKTRTNPWSGLWSKGKIKSHYQLSEDELYLFANFAHKLGVEFYFRKLPPFGLEIFYCDPQEIRQAWEDLGATDEERRARLESGIR